MIVLDASVLYAVVADDGPAGSAARAMLRGRRDVATVDIADAETLSALRKWWLRGDLTDERITAAVRDLTDLPVVRWPGRAVLSEAAALRGNLSAYDALYVALAHAIDAELVTADRRLAAAPGLRCRVRVID
jgi:predicted nucleic acid-binding protein